MENGICFKFDANHHAVVVLFVLDAIAGVLPTAQVQLSKV